MNSRSSVGNALVHMSSSPGSEARTRIPSSDEAATRQYRSTRRCCSRQRRWPPPRHEFYHFQLVLDAAACSDAAVHEDLIVGERHAAHEIVSRLDFFEDHLREERRRAGHLAMDAGDFSGDPALLVRREPALASFSFLLGAGEPAALPGAENLGAKVSWRAPCRHRRYPNPKGI